MTEREDIEMAFTRILSSGGLILSGAGISTEQKRERIRIAIMQRGIKDAPFDDSMTYGEAFHRCFARPLELRRVPREYQRPPSAIPWAVVELETPWPDDDEGDDDEDQVREGTNIEL